MKNVQKDIQSLGSIAIKIAQQGSEMMAYFVGAANMEEDQDTPGGGVTAGHTAACSKDAKKTMELETVSIMGQWCILNVSQDTLLSDAASVGPVLQIALHLE